MSDSEKTSGRGDPAYLITTSRLGLRRWRDDDRAPFARLNGDPRVMRYFPRPLSARESDEFMDRIEGHFERHGYGLYAVDLLASQRFIGFVGLQIATFDAEFTPCTEVGWRLEPASWRKGYATEGALACLEHGFAALGLDEIFSFTAAVNLRSIAVMKRIGLAYRLQFHHPKLDRNHELSLHLLYSLTADEYRSPSGVDATSSDGNATG